MSDSLTLTPPRAGGPPPTLEALALFRMKAEAAALHDEPAPPPRSPAVVLVAGEKGGTIAIAQTAEIIVLAEVRKGARLKFFER